MYHTLTPTGLQHVHNQIVLLSNKRIYVITVNNKLDIDSNLDWSIIIYFMNIFNVHVFSF